jgi:hypothetical protein
MINMENNWKAPWTPSYSLAVVGGLSAVDEVKFEGRVPVNDVILRIPARHFLRIDLGRQDSRPRFTGLFWQP